MELNLALLYQSKQRDIKLPQIALVFGMIVVLFLITISDHSLSQFISLFILLAIGYIICAKDSLSLFYGFFVISIITSKLLIYDFLQSNGTPYIGGGDDRLFNDLGVYFAKNEVDFDDLLYWAMPYKLSLFVMSGWIKIISFISNDPVSHSYLNSLLMLNSFTGALVALNLKKILISCGIYFKFKFGGLFLILFNPFILFYSSVLLREITTVYFMTASLVAIFSSDPTIRKILVVFLCLIATFFIRPVSAIIIIVISGVYYFLSVKSNTKRIILISLISIVAAAIILPNIDLILGRDVSSSASEYKEMGIEQASDNSVGAQLIMSDNPVVKMIVPIYILLSPIPPPILTNVSFFSLIISTGSISWLLVLVILMPNLYKLFKERDILKRDALNYYTYVYVMLFMALFNTFMVGFTSTDPRHLLLLYPIITPIALVEFSKEDISKYKAYYMMILFAGIGLLMFYSLLKLI